MLQQDEIKITEGGRVGLYYLKMIWSYYQQLKTNPTKSIEIEWKYINGVFNVLGIGVEPAIKYLMGYNQSFEQFENWIEENGNISKLNIDQFNAIINGEIDTEIQAEEKVFNQSELDQWDKDGYIILRNAIPKADCEKTINLIYETIGASITDNKTWYKPHPLKQGIMIQLFISPILDKNRHAKRIKQAYQQLWNRKDLIVSMDRVSFNPPETKSYQFPGPNLHWDVSLKKPIPFGLQGLLYLSDTDKNQGAFTVIPGFQHKIDDWLDQLGEDVNPREDNLLCEFIKKPIVAQAGDFIIWNQCLPHGSCPNKSSKPRIVQYINYQPMDLESQKEWI